MIGRCILRTACGKGPMDGVKLDVIDGEHQSLILPARRLVFSMASKGVVLPANSQKSQEQKKRWGWVDVFLLLVLIFEVPSVITRTGKRK